MMAVEINVSVALQLLRSGKLRPEFVIYIISVLLKPFSDRFLPVLGGIVILDRVIKIELFSRRIKMMSQNNFIDSQQAFPLRGQSGPD